MSIYQQEAFAPIGARLGKITVLPVDNGAGGDRFDISATEIWNDLIAGRLILADADGADIYYAWNSENSGTVDETATTGAATQCGRVPAGALVPFRPFFHSIKSKNSSGGTVTSEGICKYLIVKCTVASAKLRLYVCSQAPSDGA